MGFVSQEFWFDSQQGHELYIFFEGIETDYGAHPTSYSVGTRDCFLLE